MNTRLNSPRAAARSTARAKPRARVTNSGMPKSQITIVPDVYLRQIYLFKFLTCLRAIHAIQRKQQSNTPRDYKRIEAAS